MLQPFNGVTPFRCGGLADCILISEQPNLIDCVFTWHSLEPVDWNKILAVLQILAELPVIMTTFGNIEDWDFTLIRFDFDG